MVKVTQSLLILVSLPTDRRGEERSECLEGVRVGGGAASRKKAGKMGAQDSTSERQMT